MNPPIARQLWVKGGGENSVLANQHRVISPAPKHVNGHLAPCDSGGADEDPLHSRRIAKVRREVDLGDRRKDLAPVRVAFDIDRKNREAGLCRYHCLGEENDTRTGGEDRHPRSGPLYDPAGEIFGLHQPKHR